MAPVPFDVATTLVRHGTAMRALAHELVSGSADADDVVQETWLRAMRRPPADGGTSGWFATVLTNVVRRARRDDVRRRRREATVARTDFVEDPTNDLARTETTRRLLAALETLDAATRDVIWRRFFEDQPPREIAATRNEPVATVKSRLQRGIRDLREQLGKDGAGEWRAALIAAFGLGEPGATTVALGGGVLMATWTKGIAAVVVMLGALAFGSGWFAGPESAVTAGGSAVASLHPETAGGPAPSLVAPPAERAPAGVVATAVPPPRPPVAVCSGRVVTAETRRPLGGVSVAPGGAAGPTSGAARVVSGDDGRFTIEVAAGAATTLWFAHPDCGGIELSSPALLAGEVDDVGDVALPRGRSLPGRIVDTAGAPLPAGALLLAHVVPPPAGGGPGRAAMSRATVAADGRFVLPSVPFGDVTIQLPGDHELVNGQLHVDARSPTEVSLVARPRPFVAGLVVDPHGQPVAGVRLALVPPATVITTGADGSFRLADEMAMGMPARIAVHTAPDFVPPAGPPVGEMVVCADRVAWGTQDLRVVLERAALLPIEVVAADGAPIEEFGVAIDRALLGELRGIVRHRGRHDGGRFVVDCIAVGNTSIRVVPADPSISPSEVLPVASLAPQRVVLQKRLPCTVEVRKSGRPVANAFVYLVRTPSPSPWRLPPEATGRPPLLEPHAGERAQPGEFAAERVSGGRTDANGVVHLLRDVAIDQRALLVQAEGYAPLVFDRPLFPGDGSPLRVTLPEAGFVEGRIVLHGAAGRDLDVWLERDRQRVPVRVRSDGTFRSPPLAPGTWRAALRSKGAPVGGEREAQVVDAATTTIDWDLTALGGASLRGRLVRNGALPTGLTVDLVRIGETSVPERIRSLAVGPDGRFGAHDLGAGTYRIVVRSAALDAVVAPWLDGDVVSLTGSDHRDVELAFPPRRLVVTFRRADGTAVRGERVLARCDGIEWTFPFGVPVDERVVIDPAPALPLEFRLAASPTWSPPVQFPADLAEAEVTVVLPDPPK